MTKEEFLKLDTTNRSSYLKEKGELVYQIDNPTENVSLFLVDGYYVEEFRELETKKTNKIELLEGENQKERLRYYADYIEPVFENNNLVSFAFHYVEEKYIKINCVPCNYEWFESKRSSLINLKCPICDNGWISFRSPVQCTYCNKNFYQTNLKNHECPYCKK